MPSHTEDLLSARGRLVVKNTFIDIVHDSAGEPEERFRGLRVRASSDPTLFETSQQEARKEELSKAGKAEGEDEEGSVEFDLRGMSDEDVKTEDEGVAALPCYRHIAEEQPMTEPGWGASGGGSARDSPAPSEDVPTSPWPGNGSASTSQDEIQRLISENARLALENKLLRNQYMGPVVAGCAAAGPEQANMHHAQAQAAAAQEAMWVPLGFVMQPTPAMPGHSEVSAQPQPSRRQRRRNAAAQHAATLAAAGVTAGAATSEQGQASAEASPGPRTTVMLRNLPNNYTRAMVLDLLDTEGFAGKYDFLYLPIDFKSRACLGYAFINLVDSADVQRFWGRFDGYSKWVLPSKKVCHVSWSGPHQGLESHIERYRNSPVMHKSVPDEYKPVVFRDGVRVVFPSPTKTPRAPRIRHMSEFRAANFMAPMLC